jgi:hypothetical protein
MADDVTAMPEITIATQQLPQDRAAFLDGLAWNPAEALRNWGRLTQEEQAYVEAGMWQHYGDDFVKMFHDKASTDPRPDATVVATNDASMTPQRLRSAGYRHMYYNGAADVWVHPTGQEVWLMSNPNAAPAPSVPAPELLPQSQPPTHPDVVDAQNYADEFQSRFDALQKRFIQLQQYRTATGGWPPAEGTDLANEVNDLEEEIDDRLRNEASQWEQDLLTDDENAAMQNALQQIRAIRRQLETIEPSYGYSSQE